MTETPYRYDIGTAVTFFLAGLCAGSLLALILSASEISSRRASTARAIPARDPSPAL